MSAAALAPLVLVALAFIGYCELDILRGGPTRYLPRAAWAVICLVSVPLGGLGYLLLGRSES